MTFGFMLPDNATGLSLVLLVLAAHVDFITADLPHPRMPSAPPVSLPRADVPVLEVATRDLRGEDTTDADLAQLYRDNLDQDLSTWRDKALNWTNLVKLRDLCHQHDATGYFTRMILIKNNTLYYLGNYQTTNLTGNTRDAHTFWHQFEETFNGAWRKHGAPWPDVVFLLSQDDPSMCKPEGNGPFAVTDHAGSRWYDCPAPPFTSFKRPHNRDILVPSVLKGMSQPLYKFPWKLKADVAFFRGTLHCELHQRHRDLSQPIWSGCSRLYLANWTYWGPPTHGGKLDVGLTSGYGYFNGELGHEVQGCIPPASFVPLKQQARYKWLLALDGHTAPNRLGNLMRINSVILKQKSDFIEWFYRSLREGQHYITMWEHNRTDVIDVMRSWEGRDEELQHIVAAANDLGERYTSSTARMRYMIKALTEYKRLFTDMDAVIEHCIWPKVQAQLRLHEQGQPDVKLEWGALAQCDQIQGTM